VLRALGVRVSGATKRVVAVEVGVGGECLSDGCGK